MDIYAVAVLCAIVFSGAIMFVIFYRMKVLNSKTLVSIVIASLISALALPGIFYLISSYKKVNMKSSTLLVATLISAVAYIILVFIMSLITSYIISRIAVKPRKTNDLAASSVNAEDTATADIEQGENYLEQIFVNFIGENDNDSKANEDSKETLDNNEEINTNNDEVNTNNEEFDINNMNINQNNDENMTTDENNFEKAVDSAENIDKMGIENTLHDSDSLTIDECIEEAFRLKGLNDSEGAIIYYMYALDKKPKKDLTFWIILDICVMYKSLGQQELALDILNSYYDIYSDIMDISVKEEIETNLSNI